MPQLSDGLLNNYLVQNGDGSDAYLQSQFNNGAINGVAGGLSSIISGLTTGFFQAASPMVSRPASPSENQITIGPFFRSSFGRATTTLGGTSTSFGQTTQNSTNGTSNFWGVQAGLDVGVHNIDSSGWALNFGVFGGVANANSSATTVSPVPNGGSSVSSTSLTMSVPYVALYSVLSRGSFSAEVSVRRDSYDGKASSFNGDVTRGGGFLVAPNSPVTGRGVSVNALVTNTFRLEESDVFIQPLLGMTHGQYSFNSIAFNTAVNNFGTNVMNFDTVQSWLGRAGVTVGTNYLAGENFWISPFMHGAIWHEFAGDSNASAQVTYPGASTYTFGVTTQRIGTFGQVGVGASFNLLDYDVQGFVRGDVRFGNRFSSQAGSLGVRKMF